MAPESQPTPPKNVFATSLLLSTPVLVAAAIADAVGAASKLAGHEPLRARITLGVELAGYMLLPAALLGLATAFAGPRLAKLAIRVREQRLVAFSESLARSDIVNAVAVALIGFFAATSALALYLTRSFNNLDIVSFGLATGTMLLVPLSWFGFLASLALWKSLRAVLLVRFPSARPRAFFAPAALLTTIAVVLAIVLNLPTLRQLRPWFLAAPVAGLSAGLALFPIVRRLALPRTRARTLEAAVIALAAAISVAAALANRELPSQWIQSGAWSSNVIRFARVVTDFDRDGYSSLFGGGDCAPFNAKVHPGAVEIPGDGIDNNCVAGDPASTVSVARPVWYDAVPEAIPKDMNVLFITVEALRADHASFVKARRDTSPFLRKLAEGGVVFENMFSAAPITRLSIPSLLSSCNPSEIDWAQVPHKMMRHVMASTPWLPEIVQRAGYHTIAVHTDFRAFTDVEPVGFERGFERYDTSTHLSYVGGTMRGFPSSTQVDKAKDYIAGLNGERFFLWLHLVEPHYAYERSPQAPNFGADDEALYDSEVWEVDHQIERLVGYLRERGLMDKTMLFVTGDHGEEFGEHGQKWHGTNLYQPQMHPAAMLYVPGLAPRRVHEATTFTDVASTLVNLLRLKNGFEKLRNRNLTPLLFDRPVASGHVLLENFQFTDAISKNYVLGVVRWPQKLIYVEEGQSFELYDLERDPGEKTRLPVSGQAARALEDELFEYLEGSARRNISAATSAR